MERLQKHWYLILATGIISLLVLWTANYLSVYTEVPWPGGDGGLTRMEQTYFVNARHRFFISQSIILSLSLLICVFSSHLVWINKKTFIDKLSFALMVWITLTLFSVIYLSAFAVLPFAVAAIFSLVTVICGLWKDNWRIPLIPLTFCILFAFYSIYHFSAWFAVFGD